MPTVDLGPWLSGDAAGRARFAATVDEALCTAGFPLVTGHGVDPGLRAAIREIARGFFRLSAAVKEPYAVRVGGHAPGGGPPPAPVGRYAYEPVDSYAYLRAKPDAIGLG